MTSWHSAQKDSECNMAELKRILPPSLMTLRLLGDCKYWNPPSLLYVKKLQNRTHTPHYTFNAVCAGVTEEAEVLYDSRPNEQLENLVPESPLTSETTPVSPKKILSQPPRKKIAPASSKFRPDNSWITY